MAHNVKLGLAAANAEADAISALCNSGYLRLYSGTKPATADTAITGSNILLAELRFAAAARTGSSAAGVATFAAIVAEDAALATGTPTWFRALQSNGATVVFDGTVGLASQNCDATIDAVPITSGAEVAAITMTYTANRG